MANQSSAVLPVARRTASGEASGRVLRVVMLEVRHLHVVNVLSDGNGRHVSGPSCGVFLGGQLRSRTEVRRPPVALLALGQVRRENRVCVHLDDILILNPVKAGQPLFRKFALAQAQSRGNRHHVTIYLFMLPLLNSTSLGQSMSRRCRRILKVIRVTQPVHGNRFWPFETPCCAPDALYPIGSDYILVEVHGSSLMKVPKALADNLHPAVLFA